MTWKGWDRVKSATSDDEGPPQLWSLIKPLSEGKYPSVALGCRWRENESCHVDKRGISKDTSAESTHITAMSPPKGAVLFNRMI